MLVAAAAVALIVFGGGLVATSLLDLAGLASAVVTEVRDAVDGMTAIVVIVIAGVAAGLILAAAAIGILEIVVAIRLWQRVKWAWIEAIGVSVLGLVVGIIGLTDPPAADGAPLARVLQPAWGLAAVAGHIFVAVAAVVSRPWFGRLSWPKTDKDAPFWLRRDRFP